MDPMGRTRVHVTTRGTFSIPDEVFSDQSRWTFNLQGFVRIKEGLAVQAALPFALFSPPAGDNQFLVGNIRLGTAFGFDIRLQPDNRDVRSARLRIGGGVDVYLPTASQPDGPNVFGEAIVGAIRQIHSFEPELFIDDAMFFRLRAHVQLSFDFLILETEVGLSPGYTTESSPDALFLVAWGARVSAKPTYLVDPYLEASSSFHVVGKTDPRLDLDLAGTIGRDYDTPVWLTAGLRLHFGLVDPAFFASFNLDDFGVLFGIDLAGAARELVRGRSDRDFLDDVPTRR